MASPYFGTIGFEQHVTAPSPPLVMTISAPHDSHFKRVPGLFGMAIHPTGRRLRPSPARTSMVAMNLAMILDIPASIVPEEPAVLGAEGAVTYEDLRQRVSRRAGQLAALGVGPSDRVGIFATNSVGYVEALLGVASAGAVAVPMN